MSKNFGLLSMKETKNGASRGRAQAHLWVFTPFSKPRLLRHRHRDGVRGGPPAAEGVSSALYPLLLFCGGDI